MREMVDEVLAKVQSNKSPTKGTIQLGGDAQQMSACAAAEPSGSVKKARRAGKWHIGTPADEEESISACNHVCVHHQEVMSTSLWANLPTHLRVMVIAWIPLAQLMGISQSKDCKAVKGVPRSFQRAWTEVSGRNFAIVTSRDEYTSNVYGMKTETWYQSSLPLNSRSRVVATAGGLLCIAESNFYKDDNLYRISCGLPSDITFVDGFTICNPITNMWRTLPDGFQIGVAPRMIRMVMGNASKHYMLVIVGFNHNSRSLTMQV